MKMRESFLQRVGAFAGIVMAIAALCASAVLVAGAAAPRAAFADDTTYMVRVFAGNQGTVDGGNVWTTTVKAGESLQFDAGLIAVTDDRYYARGIREAGLDNSRCSPETPASPSCRTSTSWLRTASEARRCATR